MATFKKVAVFSLWVLSACESTGVPASYCAVTSADHTQIAALVVLFDEFSNQHDLFKGKLDAGGIIYAEPSRRYLVDLLPLGSTGTAIALFAKPEESVERDVAELRKFVTDVVGSKFEVSDCVHESILYGYDEVAI